MGAIDTASLLQAISPEMPCGESLEYDPDYGELERAAQGKPEQQFGDTVVPAEEPDWPDVQRRAIDLLSRTKDLRVAVALIRAAVRTEGCGGLRDGLTLVKGLVENYWESVHPQLDPEDDNDPTLRINTIATLCDPDSFLPAVREMPLVSSRTLGRYSLKDVQVAAGEWPAPPEGETPAPSMQTIDAAFMDAAAEDLEANTTAVAQSMERAADIESLLMDYVGASQALDLSALTGLLRAAHKVLSERLMRRGVVAGGDQASRAAPAAELGQGASAPAPHVALGPIASREDVVRVLDEICDYFRKQEPSSPVPLLLQRAKRLVSKDFMDIIRDLAPDGMSQVEVIRGPESDEASY